MRVENHATSLAASSVSGGEMARRTHSFNWANTPLGKYDTWPQSLKTIVRVMLDSRYAMWLGWGPEFTFLYNDAYAAMTLGPKHPWALGRSAREVWSEIWPEIGPRAESVVATGKATWDEGLLLFLQRRGFAEETYHTFSYSPVPNDCGGIGGMLCVVTEDTERAIGERRLRTLRELAAVSTNDTQSAEDACQRSACTLAANPHDLPFVLLYLLDEAGQQANLAGVNGLARNSLPCPDRVDLHDHAAPWPFRQVIETGKALEVSDLSAKFGALSCGVWPESPQRAIVLPLLKPGQSQLAGFVVTGVSPRLPFTDEYRGFLELLSGHVAAAVTNARALEEEKRRVEALAQLDRAKTAFFSNISHEFRTPLTLMLGPVEELLAHRQRKLSPAVAEQLQVVNRNGLRLLRLVNTLLDFSRIEAGRVRAMYQPTDLAAFTADLASAFRSACERAGLRLLMNCATLSATAYVDREMWEKVILNLMSNAFKFTFEGEIEVTLSQVGDTAELGVRDTGIGIAPNEMPRLFERFHRVENARGRTHEGSGIGLALVQELVKLHGGTITVQSELEKGTIFRVALPLGSAHLPADQITDTSNFNLAEGVAPFVEEALRWLPDGPDTGEIDHGLPSYFSPSAEAATPSQPHSEGDRPFVLVADDNADMRQYLVRLLGEQYRVEAVPNGEAAMVVIDSRLPDLILTDVMMPQLDGFSLLRQVRANPRTAAIPIILLSARAGEESRVEGLQAGADDYLVKPFSARELVARVSAHLQMARLRHEANVALQQSHARFEALFNAAPVGIYLVDANLRIRQVNPTAHPVFGEFEDLIGSDFVQVMHRLWPPTYANEIVARFRHTLETGEPYCVSEHIEERLDRKALEYYSWEIHRISLADDQYGVVCYFYDVSRHVLARQALAEADRRKDNYLALLAHELRNPLAPIRNGLRVISLAGRDHEAIAQARAMMERQLTQLVRIVDDLLDVSRITRNTLKLRKECVDLATVLRSAIETTQPLIEAQHHTLSVSLPPEPLLLDADLTRLAQVFINLLNNAAKYTPPRGHIRVAVSRAGQEVVITVEDNGIGIPQGNLARIFDMFSQVDRTLEQGTGSLGIGLSLVKELVEMHGGNVQVHSEGENKGSTFTVRLPLGTNSRPLPVQSCEPIDTTSLRILVVDDNRDGAKSLAMLLRLRGHEVRMAFNGLEAIEAAQGFRPEVILMDIGMPRMNGLEATKRIREEPWGKDILIVALTGWGQNSDLQRTAEAGCNMHLVKPVDLPTLERTLTKARNSLRST